MLGGHVEECDACGHQRHRLQHLRESALSEVSVTGTRRSGSSTGPPSSWTASISTSSLPCPPTIAAIAYQNKAQVYNILFRATAETLRTIAADPKHLGADIGFFAVLHTWGQTLVQNPHS